MYRVGVFLALFALSGCVQVQLEHQTDSFNKATANAISEQALLNAVRSSLDMPMSFTKLLKFTASNMASGTLVPKLPFGADAQRIFDLGPTLSLSGGVGQIEYADANSSGPLSKLNANLESDTFDRYWYQGVSPSLLLTILVEHVEIHSSLLPTMYKVSDAKCSAAARPDPRCGLLETHSAACGWKKEGIFGGPFKHPGGFAMTTIGNRADTKCNFLKFQAFRYLLALSGFWTDTAAETIKSKLKTAEGTLLDVPKKTTRQIIWFDNVEMYERYQSLEKELEDDYKRKMRRKTSKPVQQQHALKFAYRSPRALLAYLGELITLQNFKEKYEPELVVGKEAKRMKIFRVVRGRPAGEKVVISVRGPDGEVYTVPEPDYGSSTRDQTLRVLAITGEIVNGALSEKDFPAPASVVVRAFQ
jgi:hypothetical protein